MSKITFNITDLTKEVYGQYDTNSDIFISNRKRIERHIKTIEKYLGYPNKKFEAPLNELKGYTHLFKELLENPNNDKLLDLLNKRILKEKRPKSSDEEKLINSLIELYAESFAMGIEDEQEKENYRKWIHYQITHDPRPETEANLKALEEIFSRDFLLFQELNSIESNLEFQKNYIQDIEAISTAYRKKAYQMIVLPHCFLELKKKFPELDLKKAYSKEDILNLPINIQIELMSLIESKTSELR